VWYYKIRARIDKRFFPERANRWRRWKQHDPASRAAVSHDAWDDFLRRYVVTGDDGINRVRYARVSADHRAQLRAYIAGCERVEIGAYGRDEQYAFWLNMYNALTVDTVLDHYPVRSVRNIGIVPSWLGGGPWDRVRVRIGGESLTLNDIEHRILRRNWRDARIHYAINCGALGCPNLHGQAFRAQGLHQTLEQLARDFINSPRGVRAQRGHLSACKIFLWFKEDFGGTQSALLEYLSRYSGPQLRALLQERAAIDRYHYDWSLNDAAKVES
jgi:hypothetical protein